MSKRAHETDPLDLVFPSMAAGAILTAFLWGGCSHLNRVHDIEIEADKQKWDINGLREDVRGLVSRQEEKPNVITCEEYRRLVSSTPAGSTIVLNRGTIVEGPCK